MREGGGRLSTGERQLAAFARAFGTELILSGRAPKGTLRRAAYAHQASIDADAEE